MLELQPVRVVSHVYFVATASKEEYKQENYGQESEDCTPKHLHPEAHLDNTLFSILAQKEAVHAQSALAKVFALNATWDMI
jgi:hypothetical protein